MTFQELPNIEPWTLTIQSLAFFGTYWLLTLGDVGLMRARVSNHEDLHSSSASVTSCVQNFRREQVLKKQPSWLLSGNSFSSRSIQTALISYLRQRAPEYSSPQRLFGSALTSCSGKPWTHLAAVAQRQAGESARKRGQETGGMTFL